MNEPERRDDPEELRREIARTRADLGRTVTQIEYRVSPRVVARRQVRKAKGGLGRVRTAVMGSPDYDESGRDVRDQASEYADRTREQTSEYADRTREQASQYAEQARETLEEAPQRAREATAGNPLAAGLIALGVGAIAGSLLPSTRPEREAASKLREQFEEPVRQEAQRAGEQVRERVQERAQEGVDEVKGTAQQAAERTKGEARSSAEDVQHHAKGAADDVRQS